MLKIAELYAFANLLCISGIDKDRADNLVLQAVKISIKKDITVMQALSKFADSKARPESLQYLLYSAFEKIGQKKLEKIESLFITL